jgi:hypothetical protein
MKEAERRIFASGLHPPHIPIHPFSTPSLPRGEQSASFFTPEGMAGGIEVKMEIERDNKKCVCAGENL